MRLRRSTLALIVAFLSAAATPCLADEGPQAAPPETAVPCGLAVTRIGNANLERDGTIHLSPALEELDVTIGNTVNRCLTIENATGHRIDVDIDPLNLYAARDPRNGIRRTDRNVRYGVRGWLRVATERVELLEGDAASVPYAVTPSTDAEPGSHSGVLALRWKATDDGTAHGRAAAVIVANVPGNVRKTGLPYRARMPRLVFHGSDTSLSVLYRNSGDAVDTVSARLVLDPSLGVGHRVVRRIDDRLVLRSSVREIRLAWDDPPWFGRYTPHLRVESTSARRTFSLPPVLVLPPIPLVLIGLAGIVAALFYGWWQRRQSGWRSYYDEELESPDDEDW